MGEENMPYTLPYAARFFVEINDTATFWIAFLFQSPVVVYNTYYGISVGFMACLVLHVCGLLNALAFHIQNLDVNIRENPQSTPAFFRFLVERHQYIASLQTDINTVFKFLLLEELFISTVILGLTAYAVISNSDQGDLGTFLSFVMFVGADLLLLYSCCAVGEYLLFESGHVYDAYYQCDWIDLPVAVKKQLTICMIGSNKPLELSGGGIYVYSIESFMGIIKSAGGYVSMLRAFV